MEVEALIRLDEDVAVAASEQKDIPLLGDNGLDEAGVYRRAAMVQHPLGSRVFLRHVHRFRRRKMP